jgi:hypothetical protein
MKFLKTMLGLALAVSMLGGTADAQVRKAGLTGASFLKIGVGARAVALGSAYTTVRGDVNQLFWNPAGITLTDGKSQATFSYNQWIADLSHYAAGITHDFGTWGTWGVGMVAMGVSDIPATRDVVPGFLSGSYTGFVDPNTSATYNYNDTAVNISWAFQFTDRLSMGVTGKYINQSIDSESANAVAVDVGAIYDIGYKGARIGARMNNLGSDMTYYAIGAPLPLVFSIGTSINLLDQEDQGMRLTAMLDATKPQDAEQLLFAAGEFQVMKYLMVRGGYKFNYSGISDTKTDEITLKSIPADRTEEGFTLGGGIDYPLGGYRLGVDYAFTQFGILDSVHRVTMNVGF